MRTKPLFGRGKLQKMLLVTRIGLLCILAFNITAAANVFSQAFNSKMKNVTLEEVLLEIQKKSSFDIICNSEQISNIKNLSVKVENANVEEILKQCLKGTVLSYEIVDNTVVIYEQKRLEAAPQQTKIVIKGLILEADGRPLPGAAVYLKGNKVIGTVSDVDGNFQLSVSPDLIGKETLVVSFVGLKTKEMPLKKEPYRITMEAEATQLNDVVVTGYQTLSKERATGSFAVLTNKDFEHKLQPGIISRIEGMAAGLTNYKGDLRIRGKATISGVSTPLYVVDGVPYEGSLDAINPSEIANITILKDATAASIYGSRSANGVIVIMTKKGAGKSTIEYNGSVVITPLRDDRDYLNLMNSEELVDWQVEMFNTYHSPYSSSDKRYYQNEVLNLLYENEAGNISDDEMNRQLNIYRNRNNYNELKDNFLRTAITHQHNLALRGSSDRYQYSASVNYMQNILQTKGQDNDRVGFNLRSSYNFFEWLRADLGVVGSYTKADYDNGFTPSTYLTGGRASYQTLFDEDGNPLNWYQTKSQSEIDRLVGLGLNDESFYPLEEMHRKSYFSKSNYSNVNVALNVKVIEGLDVDLRYQLEKNNSLVQNYYAPQSYTLRNQINNSSIVNADGSIKHLIPEGGYIDETRSDKNSYTLRAQINFNRTFDEKHEVSAIAGGERRAVHSTSTYVEKYGYDKVSLAHKYLDEATLNQTQQGTEAINNSYTHVPNGYPDTFGDKEDRYVSFYGNASYTYDRRYAITGSIRMDQSNLFGTNPKYQYKPLWSVGVSWHMAQEKFMGNMDWLDQLSIRFTKGINGNIAKQSGPYMIVYSAGINSWTGEYSSSVSSPPNSGLRWERTNQTNLGIDFSFFNNRLGGSFDYYAKNTSDLLGSIATDPTSGWGSLTMNYAEMYNHGYEIVLNSVNIQTRDFRWATNINFSYNKNRITKLENSSNSVSSYISGTNTREGMAMGTLFSVRWAGLDESGNPQAYKKDGTIVKSLADLTVEDLVRSGTSIPPYSASMSNMLTYKGFDLSFMFLYYGGHVMRDVMPQYFTSTTGTTNVDRSIRNYWKSPEDSNDPDKAPAFMRNASTNYTYLWYAADKHIKKANYIKLKEVTLSYNLPERWLKKAFISGMSINAQIQNIWWWGSQKRRLNPESWNGTSLTSISRSALDPTIYTLGLSLKF